MVGLKVKISMKKPKVEVIYPDKFDIGNIVEFRITFSKVKKQVLKGEISGEIGRYYLYFSVVANDEVFNLLNLDVFEFCRDILYMKNVAGIWPEVRSLEQLKHMIKALEYFNEM